MNELANKSKMFRAGSFLAAIAASIVLTISPSATSDVFAEGSEPSLVAEITPELTRAVDKGLAFLAAEQADNGSFGSRRFSEHVGITGLSCMAFMSAGHQPGRGEYGHVVQRGLDFVVANAQETGLIAADASHGPMYGHGFATLFLAEVYGQVGDGRVRDALSKAVRLIVSTQNHEGGWRYHPRPADADISVTICQIMALRAARNAGISVPKEVIDRAIVYVRRCQNDADGGFRYMLSGGGSAFPRSAAGVASLFYAGVYEDDAITAGMQYLVREYVGADQQTSRGIAHYYYGHYYAVQAAFLAGGGYWDQWFPRIRRDLIEQQQPNGSWNSSHGEAYATAMSLLILQIPNRLMPIFQR